jgi:hypothetical protein
MASLNTASYNTASPDITFHNKEISGRMRAEIEAAYRYIARLENET